MSDLAEALQRYLHDLNIASVDVEYTVRDPSFRGSSVSAQGSGITAAARERHLVEGYGFWEHVVASSVTAQPDTRRGLYAGAVRSRIGTVTTKTMTVEEFVSSLDRGQWEQLPGRQIISLSSHVTTRYGATGHLHLLDFGLPNRPHLAEAFHTALSVLDIDGILVATGRSYHLYGRRITGWDAYTSFLARAALLSPVVDARWVLHQLTEGHAALRVSSNTDRDTHLPKPEPLQRPPREQQDQ